MRAVRSSASPRYARPALPLTRMRYHSSTVGVITGLAQRSPGRFYRPQSGVRMRRRREGDAMTRSAKVYELRIYHAVPGKLESLVARFRDYTDKLFAKHGMKSLAYWTALDEPAKSSTFFYILEHPSRGAGASNLKALPDGSA